VQKVANAVRKAFDAEGILVQQFNEPAAGQTVFHLHFHIIPRWEGDPLAKHGGGMASPGELKALADQISAAWPQ
jgi:histidine triad (HIT) family protein